MEFEGVVYKVLPAIKGTSARGEWTKQDVIFELPGEFSRKVCVSFWGDKAQEGAMLKEGEKINVSTNVESKEYNGRWFTEVRAWRIQKVAAQQPDAGAVPFADMPPFTVEDEAFTSESKGHDDLPF